MSKSQQDALVIIEHEIRSRHGRLFNSFEEVSDYVTGVLESDWWLDRFSKEAVNLVSASGGYSLAACQSEGDGSHTIIMTDKGFHQMVILHELAHVVSPRGHGNEFVDCFLKIMRQFMGWFAYAEFYEALKQTREFVL